MYRCKYPNRPGFCSPSLTPYSDRPEEQTPHFYTKVKDPLTSAENCHKAFKFINPQLLLTAFHQAALPLSALLLPDFLIRSSLHKRLWPQPHCQLPILGLKRAQGHSWEVHLEQKGALSWQPGESICQESAGADHNSMWTAVTLVKDYRVKQPASPVLLLISSLITR